MDLSRDSVDVVIVGGGHAGTEAALAAARLGANTLLITQSIETIGQLSCNPAMGGIGKSHLIREIDALGGAMALATDEAGIHYRTLNVRKGPAVQALRAQVDRNLYRNAIRRAISAQPNLRVFQDSVVDIDIRSDRVHAVTTGSAVTILTNNLVLATGTFLGGRIFIGNQSRAGGRAGDPPANLLAQKLRDLPFRVRRLKTGTPPRIDGRTVDFSSFELQPGEDSSASMSFLARRDRRPRQLACHITYTNPKTHAIIRNHIDDSPMYSGAIEGIGPRYCPSIEDKVMRFAERDRHQIFVEPEGLDTPELYPNGVSTSLPYAVQVAFVRSIAGFERAHITRPGYAIEYDFFDPRDLAPTLETKVIEGLFFAGQINGTTGYEEAGSQGLLAGLNAARKANLESTWYPRRHEAYLGVLVDDLTVNGTNEPYRMFTSRAEYRLRLRQDNADARLTEQAYTLGLIEEDRWQYFRAKMKTVTECRKQLKSTTLSPGSADAEQFLRETGMKVSAPCKLETLLKRPVVDGSTLHRLGWLTEFDLNTLCQSAIDIKYEGYLDRQDKEIEQSRAAERVRLSAELNYELVEGLSNELKQKLNDARPDSMAVAARIPGITPAALSLIAVHAKRLAARQQSAQRGRISAPNR